MQEQELSARIAIVQERIAAAAGRAGRVAGEVTLVAVTKTQPAEVVVAAYTAGLRLFGENRVEEAGPKVAAVARLLAAGPAKPGPGVENHLSEAKKWPQPLMAGPAEPSQVQPVGFQPPIFYEPPAWHVIGHVQSRKAADVLPWVAMVHSVESEKLARRLSHFLLRSDDFSHPGGRTTEVVTTKTLPILLEVNISGEASKDGVTPEQAPALVETILALPGLRIEGLMTVAPIAADPEEVRPVFADLRRLRDDLARRFPAVDWRHLSMGMTDDFEVAIEEGATMVRVGRAIFGERM